MTLDSYFMILVEVFTNHILAENTYFLNRIEWTEHKIMVLQPANKYQIIWKCYNFKIIFLDNFHHQFLYWAKVLYTIFFTKLKNKMKRWQIAIETLIYYFIYSGGRKALCNIRKFDLSCGIEMYYFEKLS